MYKKFLDFQKTVSSIKKDCTNPFFKSSYFDINSLLEIVVPALNDIGIVVLQPIVNIGDKSAIKTLIIDSETDEELANGCFILPGINDPQKMGSAITYYRRYALQSTLGLRAEDDDGNSASNLGTENKKEIIASLCKKSGFTGNTAKEYELFVFANTTYVLKPENYDLIIEKLKKLTK